MTPSIGAAEYPAANGKQGQIMRSRHMGLLLGTALSLAVWPVLAAVPMPQVSGPIAAPDVPGAPSHNYIFFSSNHDLPQHGYVEEEYFIRGTANTYNIPDELKDGTVAASGQPYYTRVVVRRPADPRLFNGKVLVEWDNVTNQFDAENVWFFDWEHMMREGYVWVGVSPQTIGIAALKKFSPTRYGDLDVGKVVAGTVPRGGPDADAMSYDIFSQVGEALKHPGGVDMLHGLKPKLVIATGESQSATRLATYINSIHPSARVYDGFLLLSAIGRRIRDDLVSPVIKVNAEHDVVTGDVLVKQPDTDKFRSWDVAGTSHVDQHLRASREPLELRDNGLSLEAKMAPLCANPQVGTRTPMNYVVASAFDKLSVWAAGGEPPPTAPHLDITQVNPRPQQSVVARNADGLAQGRHPAFGTGGAHANQFRRGRPCRSQGCRRRRRGHRRGRLCALGLFDGHERGSAQRPLSQPCRLCRGGEESGRSERQGWLHPAVRRRRHRAGGGRIPCRPWTLGRPGRIDLGAGPVHRRTDDVEGGAMVPGHAVRIEGIGQIVFRREIHLVGAGQPGFAGRGLSGSAGSCVHRHHRVALRRLGILTGAVGVGHAVPGQQHRQNQRQQRHQQRRLIIGVLPYRGLCPATLIHGDAPMPHQGLRKPCAKAGKA